MTDQPVEPKPVRVSHPPPSVAAYDAHEPAGGVVLALAAAFRGTGASPDEALRQAVAVWRHQTTITSPLSVVGHVTPSAARHVDRFRAAAVLPYVGSPDPHDQESANARVGRCLADVNALCRSTLAAESSGDSDVPAVVTSRVGI